MILFKSGFVLDTPEKIQAAIFNKSKVCVWQEGIIIDYGGVVTKQTEDCVIIGEKYFLKATCEFRIR